MPKTPQVPVDPSAISRELHTILALGVEVRRLYTWAHTDVMSTLHSHGMEVGSRNGHSDSTGEAAMPHLRKAVNTAMREKTVDPRRQLDTARRKVEEAADRLKEARRALEAVVGKDQAQITKPSHDAVVTKSDLAESVQSQQRRDGRGEGFGVA